MERSINCLKPLRPEAISSRVDLERAYLQAFPTQQNYLVISMVHTLMSVGWLKFFTQHTDTDISVNKEIRTVYTTLRQEGVDVQITKIDENCNCQTVEEEEINEEQEQISYRLEVDLANSNMPMRRFNELLESWGVTEVSN